MSTPEGNASPALEELDREECLRLISPGGVGRVAFDDGEGPTVIPVNYVMDGEAVVIRTTFGGRLHWTLTTAMEGAEIRIAFEVDEIDSSSHEGWSVLVRGGAHNLGEDEPSANVEPWPGGDREARIRIATHDVTGRRLHQF
ncbi:MULTISPECIES: pyridoxamine 5'-phosphate oxidase family protein [Actinomadura]|uniref:Pyridoxamine 5'-phosphate oxidase family protein n=1 Tax=Actinomadura yumaensis TaxID=111807 RepID=A0ABW2D2L0_9ACTN|nr:pyridoxamine 5'-phosphate oxidase family protein [Actinomadura sp. J1-007]MWK37471.1 pyridoxamine 5'-phosphate oxidase family protein [Actinomadura sp. J1-007]